MKKLALLCVLALCLSFGAISIAEEKVEEPAWKSVSLIQLETGESHNLGTLTEKGKNVVVFMQTACSACRGELTFLRKLKKEADFNVIAVSVDVNITKERLAKFISDFSYEEFTFLSDPDYSVPPMFNVSFTPASVLIIDGEQKELFKGYRAAVQEKLKEALK